MAPSTMIATAPNSDHVNGNGESSKATASGSNKPVKAMSKNQLRRLKAKQKKTEVKEEEPIDEKPPVSEPVSQPADDDDLVPEVDLSDPSMAAFANVFQKFQQQAGVEEPEEQDKGPEKAEVIYSDEEEDDEEERERALANAQRLSKKKRRQMAKLSVAELKTLVSKPEVVEWFDCDARDPRLLVELKSYRNSIPVPVHWSQKREYLGGKKGIEKPPFQLPAWIADTGIAEQRDTIKEKEATMTLKQKTRERVQPKMGKIDIDYQKLHDAFFKFQSKPSMSGFGEAYYEGKELETDLRMKRPGDISEELKEALSIPPMAPPPWLIAMQRFGPPPSYPNLRIPGLNAPIPPGCQWGFHAGGWGRPPVDEYNRPLYGDPFGVMQQQEQQAEEQIDKELWGQLEPEQEESEEEESDEEAEEDQEDLLTTGHEPADGFETPSGLDTPGGMQSVVSTVPAGLETPDFMQLRKEARAESDVSSTPMPRELYQVIPERQTSAKGFMGSSTAYDVAAVTNPSSAAGPRVLGQEDRGSKRKSNDVDMALDPEQLEGLSQEDLRARYDAGRAAASKVYVPGADVDRSDFGDVIAKESAKRTRTNDRGKDRKEKEKFKF